MCLHNIYHRALLTMNVSLDIYIFSHIMIIVFIIFSSLHERVRVCHSKENCVMDDMYY